MQRLVLAAALGAVAFSTAHAASLTLSVDGQASTTYTLTSLTVDSAGNVKVAASGGSAPTDPGPTDPGPTDPGPTDPGPTDPGPTDPPPNSGGCVASDTLTCVDTPLPAKVQSRLSFRPVPTMVYAFKITTPASGTYFNRVIATGMSGATSSKLLVISKVPGDVSLSGKDLGCYRQATESTSVQLAVNNPAVNKYLNCRLDPNTVYYINAASKDLNGKTTCTSTSNCGFYFEGA
ncbi:hypothetical protein ebA1597 [Aromatoleum aromaticum EbN1]|uniref:Uncharacterized protein n=1 Tax=Aromatoleum aromaticum (strain DSM 19018 / LMG 30748 / EbN1) TaxID=76114 RepID=Q5P6R7_AROAE|nr:hypothetical protein [Aromatoleum aromaticum]CAI06994.1 hypothetical protein ebA1597 [Aromatoleum aromaticum EbN1]